MDCIDSRTAPVGAQQLTHRLDRPHVSPVANRGLAVICQTKCVLPEPAVQPFQELMWSSLAMYSNISRGDGPTQHAMDTKGLRTRSRAIPSTEDQSCKGISQQDTVPHTLS